MIYVIPIFLIDGEPVDGGNFHSGQNPRIFQNFITSSCQMVKFEKGRLNMKNLTILVFAFIVGILSTIAAPAASPPNDIIRKDNVSNNSATHPAPDIVRLE